MWCFDFDGPGEPGSLPEELICSLLALTLRYLHEQDQGQHYADDARTLIMLRIANGTVELATIESLCLLSYSSFIGTSTPRNGQAVWKVIVTKWYVPLSQMAIHTSDSST